MRYVLAVLAVCLNGLDNLTTYLCLSTDVDGFQVYEANPLAAWSFDRVGLESGLVVEMLMSIGAIAFLVATPLFPPRVKLGLLMVLVALPGWAVANNLQVMRDIGLSLF